MKILVTGATGFLGAHVCHVLAGDGHLVHALCRHPLRVIPGVVMHSYDGTYPAARDAVRAARPDVILHLATRFLKDHEPDDIGPLIAANVAFGTFLLEAAAAMGCNRFVTAGTAWQHFNSQDESYSPANLYAATKQAFEDIARWYASKGRMCVTALHLSDTYGPHDPRPKLLQLLSDAVRDGVPLRLTAGIQKVDPLYVSDAVSAFVVAANRDTPGFSCFRVSPGNPVTVRSLVETWCEINGVHPALEWGALPYRPNDVMEPWIGGQVLPSWHAKTSLRAGLAAIATHTPLPRSVAGAPAAHSISIRD